MSLIEQAAKRLEQLRQAGVELPEEKFAQDLTEQVQVQKDTELESRQPTPGSGADAPRAVDDTRPKMPSSPTTPRFRGSHALGVGV